MKILHIISSLGAGGAEVYVRDIAIQMQNLGHQVCICYISRASSTNNSQEFENEFKLILDNARVRYEELGHHCRHNLWLGVYRLRKITMGFKPDIIHSHLYYGLLFIFLSCIKKKIIYTHHDELIKTPFLFKIFNIFTDKYIGISKDCEKHLKRVTNRPTEIIYNGVDHKRIIVKNNLNKGDKLNIISVGNLHERKNYDLMIRSIYIFFKKNNFLEKKIIFTIVGEGKLQKNIQQLINSLKLQKKISLLGNRKDVSQLLHDADIFLMSSDYEGLPISLLEALMTGLPIIVTDVGGCRDVVESCDAGIIVPPKNTEAMADALYLMTNNTTKRIKWSQNAKYNAKKFDISISVNTHLNVYRLLLLK